MKLFGGVFEPERNELSQYEKRYNKNWNALLDSIGPKESVDEQKAEKEIKKKLRGWEPETLSLKLILCLEEGLWSLAEEKMTKTIKNRYARICTK